MASHRQISANRRNARKSTGPRTTAGKLRSRRNALKHGLTAETVVTVIENSDDYEAFEGSMVRAYAPQSEIEHQLVARLSSLLWRLRRATAIETGLFQIQGQIIAEHRAKRPSHEGDDYKTKTNIYSIMGLFPKQNPVNHKLDSGPSQPLHAQATADQKNIAAETGTEVVSASRQNSKAVHRKDGLTRTVAQCFMRVARLDDSILDRFSRYEAALWKQAGQLIHILAKSKRSNAESDVRRR